MKTFKKIHLRYVFLQWKNTTSAVKIQNIESEENRVNSSRHKKKVSELIQKPFSVLLLNTFDTEKEPK